MRGRARAAALIRTFLGLALAVTIMSFYFNSRVPMWEYRAPDGSYVIGWRTAAVFLLIVAATQWLAVLVFRQIRRAREKSRRSME
jgi:hypothetical protein